MSTKSTKRSMISEGILSQINSIGQASDTIIAASIPSRETNGQPTRKTSPGRPTIKPPCTKITLELPNDLLECVRKAASEKTGGNRTLLIERILRGEITL